MPMITADPTPPARSSDWHPDDLVSELSITAAAIGIEDADLTAALGAGKTVAEVARAHGVSSRTISPSR
jgi:lambda repressor-like predicted transcriptional regulator